LADTAKSFIYKRSFSPYYLMEGLLFYNNPKAFNSVQFNQWTIYHSQ